MAQASAKWTFEDFFTITPAEEVSIKKELAELLGANHGDQEHQDRVWAHGHGGVSAFDPQVVQQKYDAYQALKLNGNPDELNDSKCVSLVVSGLQVRWRTGSAKNIGYIKEWRDKNLKSWDTSLERRAGGIDNAVDWSFQAFTCTNESSLYALLATAVEQLKTRAAIEDHVAHSFMRLRVALYLDATADEIMVLNQSENIEQHDRKRHIELDNISAVEQWMESVRATSADHKLNASSALDIWKYACALGDPRSPSCPKWLMKLMKDAGKSDTKGNRLAAVGDKKAKREHLEKEKATTPHPQMRTYQDIQARQRFLKGFDAVALGRLRTEIADVMGRQGIAKAAFPVSRTVLLDPAILTSAAFGKPKELEQVPAWRDGAAGKELQLQMVEVLKVRYFDHGYSKQADKVTSVFANGAHWAAVARLLPAVIATMRSKWGPQETSWPDAVQTLRYELWRGEHDKEITALAQVLPGNLDSTPAVMQKRLMEQFSPLGRVIRMLVEQEQAQAAQFQKDDDKKTAETKTEGEGGKAPAETIPDGDVTQVLAKQASVQEKQELVKTMNAAAVVRRPAGGRYPHPSQLGTRTAVPQTAPGYPIGGAVGGVAVRIPALFRGIRLPNSGGCAY